MGEVTGSSPVWSTASIIRPLWAGFLLSRSSSLHIQSGKVRFLAMHHNNMSERKEEKKEVEKPQQYKPLSNADMEKAERVFKDFKF